MRLRANSATHATQKRRRGRPTRLTPEIATLLIKTIRSGSTLKHASEVAGVSITSLHTWKYRGARESSGRFSEFFNALRG